MSADQEKQEAFGTAGGNVHGAAALAVSMGQRAPTRFPGRDTITPRSFPLPSGFLSPRRLDTRWQTQVAPPRDAFLGGGIWTQAGDPEIPWRSHAPNPHEALE